MSNFIFEHFKRLEPHEVTAQQMNMLLQHAQVLDTEALSGIMPLYIMNIVDYSPLYRSLMIDMRGNLWVSTRTTGWIVDQWTTIWGCSYELLSNFFKDKPTLSTKPLPFVWGNVALVKVGTRGNRQYDWVNVSMCETFQCCKWRRRAKCTFYFQIEHAPFVVHLDWSCLAVIDQLRVAIAMNRAWFVHHATTLSKQQFPFTCQPSALFERKFAVLKTSSELLPYVEPDWVAHLEALARLENH